MDGLLFPYAVIVRKWIECDVRDNEVFPLGNKSELCSGQRSPKLSLEIQR